MWIWVVVAFIVGAIFGALIMGMLCAESANLYTHEDRWWEDRE